MPLESTTTRFEVLGDPTRRKILSVLSLNRSMRAKDILENLDISQPTLSHHMRLLCSEKILDSRKVGRECFYSVNEETILQMIDELRTFLSSKPEKEKKEEKKDKKDKKKKKKDKKEKNK